MTSAETRQLRRTIRATPPCLAIITCQNQFAVPSTRPQTYRLRNMDSNRGSLLKGRLSQNPIYLSQPVRPCTRGSAIAETATCLILRGFKQRDGASKVGFGGRCTKPLGNKSDPI
jgi:hypothetical protein